MAPSIGLQRLLDLREAEEARSRQDLERAVAELRQLEGSLMAARKRRVAARKLVASSAETGEVIDRIAGLQVLDNVDLLERVILQRIDEATKEAHRKRQEVMNRRIARRQVEAIVDARMTDARLQANRTSQSALDDWYRTQKLKDDRRTH